MTYRTEDERNLILSFLVWLVAQPCIYELAIPEGRRKAVEAFMKGREKHWGKP